MTKLQTALVTAVVVAGVTTTLMIQQQAKSRLQTASLHQQVEQLTTENARLSNQVARAVQLREAAVAAASAAPAPEVVAAARPTSTAPASAAAADPAGSRSSGTNDTSMISNLTMDPQVRKLIRDRQKAGMEMIYKDLGKKLNLSTNLTDKLNDVLADDVMENIDQVTRVLREGRSADELNQVFAAQDAALQEKVQAILGPDNYPQYQEYTHNLLSSLTHDQFKAAMEKQNPLTDEQSRQLMQIMQEETQAAIGRAGLDANYQPVPILNFRNFASEEVMDSSLKLLGEIYENAAGRAAAFLSPTQLAKFNDFRADAVSNSRAAIVMNRKMMAPAAH